MDGFISESLDLLADSVEGLENITDLGPDQRTEILKPLQRTVQTVNGGAAMVGLTDIRNLGEVIAKVLNRMATMPRAIDEECRRAVSGGLIKLVEMIGHAHDLEAISCRAELAALESILHKKAAKCRPSTSRVDRGVRQRERIYPILVVEDNRIVGRLLSDRLSREHGFLPIQAQSLAEAKERIESGEHEFFAALLDLNLPDAPNGEIVDYAVSKSVPSIVLTGTISDEVRESVLAKNVVDYVIKSGSSDLDYVVNLLLRLQRNRGVKVMVVEDSIVLRRHIRKLLELRNYQVVEAEDGEDALELLNTHPDTKVVITDYIMPRMDGLELVAALRTKYDKRKLAVVGVSAEKGTTLTAKFLKNGANDFLLKPFLNEEFYCRIDQNVEFLELIETLRQVSLRDELTGLFNRRHFFQEGRKIHREAAEGQSELSFVMIDVDHFKSINDTLGHPFGDQALRHLSHLLTGAFGDRGLVARFGGEEFCVLVSGQNLRSMKVLCDVFRKKVEQTPVEFQGQTRSFTVSMGLSHGPGESLDDMVKRGDDLLYQAKKSGRNRVMVED